MPCRPRKCKPKCCKPKCCCCCPAPPAPAPTPTPPVAVDDSYELPVNSTLVVTAPGVLGNDTANGNTLTVTANTAPGNGATLDGGVVRPDGSFTYSSGAFIGNTTFTYTINGGSTATVTVRTFGPQ